ncbi:MAG: hypothetical protein PHI65_06250 [Firmicutes bacterium]|nr:hypothetical protein [Bacillota bacterium]
MKRTLLLVVVFLSLQCSAALIISPAIFEGIAGDFPETLTVDIYNQGKDDVVVEVEILGLTQKANGVISASPNLNAQLMPKSHTIVVEAASKASVKLKRENVNESLYEVAVVRQVASDTQVFSQAIAVPFILKKGDSSVEGELEELVFSQKDENAFFEIKIKNNGLEHFKTELRVSMLDNGEISRSYSTQGIVLPGVTRVFNIQIPLYLSKTTGQLEVKIGNEDLVYDISLDLATDVVEYVLQK